MDGGPGFTRSPFLWGSDTCEPSVTLVRLQNMLELLQNMSMLLHPPQVEHLWFQQKQVEASSRKRDCALCGGMGNCYTEAQCEAIMMCGIIIQ